MMKRVHLKIRWNDNSKNSETEKSPPGKTHLARSLIASVCFRSPLYPFTVKDNRVSVGRGEDSAATRRFFFAYRNSLPENSSTPFFCFCLLFAD